MNYCLASLTSIVVKLLESLMRQFLMNHLIKNCFFTDELHGFNLVESTILCNTTLVATEKWPEALNEGISAC